MAYPVADSYNCASGGTIAAGRFQLPTWHRTGALASALSGMSSGSWLDWSESTTVRAITDVTGPDGAAAWLESAPNYPMTNWPGKATFDTERGVVALVGTAQGYSSEIPAGAHSSAVYLDVSTGQFEKQWNPMGVNLAHVYDGNCSVVMAGKIYRKPYNSASLFECDVASRVWSLKKSLTALSLDAVTSIDVFPDLGTTGSVMFLTGTGKLCRYDLATDALSTIGTYSGIGSYAWLHYCPSGGYVVFGGGNSGASIYKLSAAGSVALITTTLPGALTGTGAGAGVPVVPDSAGTARSWVFTTNAWSLDHETGAWSDHGAIPAGLSVANACPAAIHGAGAFIFLEGAGRVSASVSNSQVWLFKV